MLVSPLRREVGIMGLALNGRSYYQERDQQATARIWTRVLVTVR